MAYMGLGLTSHDSASFLVVLGCTGESILWGEHGGELQKILYRSLNKIV